MNVKGFLIALAVTFLANGLGDLTHEQWGWDAQSVTSLVFSFALLFALDALFDARNRLEDVRVKARVALDRLEAARTRGHR